jgi:porphobilinogen deaminase
MTGKKVAEVLALPEPDRAFLAQQLIASLDGSKLIRVRVAGPADLPDDLGKRGAQQLLNQGAREILAAVHAEVPDIE